jgi:hypothetical protein
MPRTPEQTTTASAAAPSTSRVPRSGQRRSVGFPARRGQGRAGGEERDFPVEKDAVGSIDFNEDMTVQVFTPYQGRIIALFADRATM